MCAHTHAHVHDSAALPPARAMVFEDPGCARACVRGCSRCSWAAACLHLGHPVGWGAWRYSGAELSSPFPAQILTQEDWNVVLYNGMASTSPWASLYFVALMTFGNYVLFNLLVAILVEGFQAEVTVALVEEAPLWGLHETGRGVVWMEEDCDSNI